MVSDDQFSDFYQLLKVLCKGWSINHHSDRFHSVRVLDFHLVSPKFHHSVALTLRKEQFSCTEATICSFAPLDLCDGMDAYKVSCAEA